MQKTAKFVMLESGLLYNFMLKELFQTDYAPHKNVKNEPTLYNREY